MGSLSVELLLGELGVGSILVSFAVLFDLLALF